MYNTVLHGDCLDLLKDIPDHSIDMIFADLPYQSTKCGWDTKIPLHWHYKYEDKIFATYEEFDTFLNKNRIFDINIKEYYREGLWQHYERIIKDNGAIALTATQPYASELVTSNQGMFRYDWIWEKTSSTGHLNAKKMPMRSHESVLIFYKKLPIYNPQKTTGHVRKTSKAEHKINCVQTEVYGEHGLTTYDSTERYPRSVLKIPSDKQKCAIHSTQKPVALVEYMIKTYTNENATILDNVAGSFTTAIACLNTNRNYICMEKEKKYFDLGSNRIEEHLKLQESK